MINTKDDKMGNLSEKDAKILMETAELLKDVSKDEGLHINYAKICWGAMKVLQEIWGEEYHLPIDVKEIYKKLGVDVKKVDLNEFMEGRDEKKVNRIIGKISIRPHYMTGNKKTTVYVDEKAASATVNYALAHELCHLILNYNQTRYTDDYCIMPMLPKLSDELIADAFAVFLLIPFDCFLEKFKEYIKFVKKEGMTPIGTKEWLTYLGSAAMVPNYYVACAYEQIRQVAFLIYKIHTEKSEDRAKYENIYGEGVKNLYESVKEQLTEELLSSLYQ